MTPETTAQDDFLRRFAEALGWEDTPPFGFFPVGRESGFFKVLDEWWKQWNRREALAKGHDWLLTLDGQAYLVDRARAEGWVYWTFNDFNGGLLVQTLYRQDEVCVEDIPEWSTRVAYAVAKMKGVPLPEGVE